MRHGQEGQLPIATDFNNNKLSCILEVMVAVHQSQFTCTETLHGCYISLHGRLHLLPASKQCCKRLRHIADNAQSCGQENDGWERAILFNRQPVLVLHRYLTQSKTVFPFLNKLKCCINSTVTYSTIPKIILADMGCCNIIREHGRYSCFC